MDGVPKGWNSENLPLHTCNNQLVCGSLTHNLRHCYRVVVPREWKSFPGKTNIPSVWNGHLIVSRGQLGYIIPVKQLIKRAMHSKQIIENDHCGRREGRPLIGDTRACLQPGRYALTAVTQQRVAAVTGRGSISSPGLDAIQSPTPSAESCTEAGVLAQGREMESGLQ